MTNETAAVRLRPAGPDDEAFLFQVFAASRAPELARVPWDDAQKRAFLTFQFQAQQAYYQREFTGADHHIILADGTPAGRLYVHRRADEIRILDVALLPAHRGRGLGGAVLRPLLEEATAAGKPVRIFVEQYQEQGRAVLAHLGFEQAEDHGVSVLLAWTPPA